jgi:hypothetical protein
MIVCVLAWRIFDRLHKRSILIIFFPYNSCMCFIISISVSLELFYVLTQRYDLQYKHMTERTMFVRDFKFRTVEQFKLCSAVVSLRFLSHFLIILFLTNFSFVNVLFSIRVVRSRKQTLSMDLLA